MFQAIRKWWNGLWEKEESPGPKITKENIERVKETIDEIRSGSFDRVKPTGTGAECIAAVAAGQQRQFQRKHVETVEEDKKDRKIKFATSSHVTIQRGVNGPVETEIIDGKHRVVTRDNVSMHVDDKGDLLPIGGLESLDHPKARVFLPGVEISFIAEPGIEAARKYGFDELEETAAERLADPKPVRVSLNELDADTAVPTPRKPRRRGKRGGAKRNNRSKKK